MSKTMIVKLFWGSLIAFAAASFLLAVAGTLLYLSGSLVMSGPDMVGLERDAFALSMVAVALFAVFAAMGAAVAQLVAWIGAVLDTVQLPDKAWFVVLLVTGLLGVGLVAMLAYAIAGPDGTQSEGSSPEPALPAPRHETVAS